MNGQQPPPQPPVGAQPVPTAAAPAVGQPAVAAPQPTAAPVAAPPPAVAGAGATPVAATQVEEWPTGDLPEQTGQGGRTALAPAIYAFRLPMNLAQLWASSTYKDFRKVLANGQPNPTLGQQVPRWWEMGIISMLDCGAEWEEAADIGLICRAYRFLARGFFWGLTVPRTVAVATAKGSRIFFFPCSSAAMRSRFLICPRLSLAMRHHSRPLDASMSACCCGCSSSQRLRPGVIGGRLASMTRAASKTGLLTCGGGGVQPSAR